MTPSISIIVPVYNMQKYLKRCVSSLVQQSLIDIEIIIVNDGSTDDCPYLLDEFDAQDERITIIHKRNGGLSSARNAALEVAKGEYIGFVDADDWVHTEMFEHLYNSALENSSDVVMSGFYRVDDNDNQEEHPIQLGETLYIGKSVINEILMPMIGVEPDSLRDIGVEMCVWKNIYRRDLIVKNNIRFVSERVYISEDIIFHLDIFRYAMAVSVVHNSFYYYFKNEQSLTQIYRKDRFAKECILYEYIHHRLTEMNLLECSELKLNRTFIGRTRVCIIKEARDNQSESVFARIRNIQRITSAQLLKKLFKNYPIKKLPLKLKIAAYLTKYHFVCFLPIIYEMKKIKD